MAKPSDCYVGTVVGKGRHMSFGNGCGSQDQALAVLIIKSIRAHGM